MFKTLTAAALLVSGSFGAALSAGDSAPQAAPPKASILIPISGLTAENSEALAPLLSKAGIDPEHCSDQAKEKGCCDESAGDTAKAPADAGCEMTGAAKRIVSVEPDVEKQLARLVVAPKQQLRLSQIAAALEESDFAVNEDQLVLTGDVVISVEGLTCGGCAGKLTKQMQTLEGAKTAKAVFTSKEESFLNLTTEPAGVPYARLLSAVEETSYFVADVSWNGVAAPEKGSCCEAEKVQ